MRRRDGDVQLALKDFGLRIWEGMEHGAWSIEEGETRGRARRARRVKQDQSSEDRAKNVDFRLEIADMGCGIADCARPSRLSASLCLAGGQARRRGQMEMRLEVNKGFPGKLKLYKKT